MQLNEKENRDSPIQRVLDLKRGGRTNQDIPNTLRKENFGNQEISSALDQATVKGEINPDEVPSPAQATQEIPKQEYSPQQEAPLQSNIPTFAPEPAGRANYEMVEQIAESVVSEKWEDMVKNVGDLRLWKEKVETDLSGVKQEILRTQSRFENLQKAVLGKVTEYSAGITDLNAEMKAMEKVFEKILEPLTRSVKDLEKVTQKIKK
ncbi:hypothetical protein K8R33_03775 [archaeon]|nr:hypothetical protein [archaeon]